MTIRTWHLFCSLWESRTDVEESVVGVGFDIACGNAVIRADLTLASFGDDVSKLRETLTSFANDIQDTVSFGIGRKNRAEDAPVGHVLFESPVWEDVILRGGAPDESPHVYRRLPQVLEAQQGTIDVLHTLRPVIVVMDGANEFDPYKD